MYTPTKNFNSKQHTIIILDVVRYTIKESFHMFQATNYKQFRFVIMLAVASFLLISCAESLPPGGGGPTTTFDQASYDSANEFRGGRLYDKWWEIKNISAPTKSNPIWEAVIEKVPAASINGNNGGQWRCKECHGWDYKGSNGAYAQGSSHYTGIRAFDTSNQKFTPEHVFRMISNGLVTYGSKKDIPHVYAGTGFMSTADAYDLAKFIYEVARIDNASPTLGDVTRGEVVFNNIPNALDSSWNCATAGCHSQASTNTPTLDDIIAISKDDPQEFLHKVRFGSPTGSMPFGMNVIQAQDVLAFVAAGANSVTVPSSNFSQTTYDSKGRSDVVKGGKLYDKWWSMASGATEPTDPNPRWPASNITITGSATWRCKECHGWDYRGADGAYASGKHATGFRGIVATSSFTMQYPDASSVYSFLKEDTTHGFAGLFSDDEYYALTKFVIDIRSEVMASQSAVNFIDDLTLLTKNGADAANGKVLYETKNTITCSSSSCHGEDGKRVDFADENPDVFPNEFVHNIAQENPWEFMHKIRFGDAGWEFMPSMYDASDATITTINAAADVLAYSQINLVPNIKRAGLLYDKWWNVDGIINPTEPTTRNKTWVANAGTTDATKVSDSATWRCKECHGWDYQGVHGAYAEGSKHYSGIRGYLPVLNTVNKDKTYLMDVIKNGAGSTQLEDHDFGRFLSDTDIGLLADFIMDETLGVPKSVATYNGYLANGNPTSGKIIYQETSPGNCEGCHGANGTTISTVDIAAIANDNPQEFFHKSRYGQPGSNMLPSSTGFAGLTLEAASDVLAYSKTLSVAPGPDPDPGTYSYATADVVRGGRLYDKWWKEMQATDDTVLPPAAVNPYWLGRSENLPVIPADSVVETSWRCKSCHAWDYKGTGYETGTPSSNGADNLLYKIELRRTSTFPNNDTALQQHMYDWIKSGLGTEHQFGTATAQIPSALGERELWDLTRFLLEGGLIDSDSNILNSGIVIGTSNSNGEGLYTGSVDTDVNCVACHGANGDTPPPADQGGSGEALDIFAIAAAVDDPWEFLHKTRFGQPGTSMPAIIGTNNLTNKDAFDILGYSQQSFNAR